MTSSIQNNNIEALEIQQALQASVVKNGNDPALIGMTQTLTQFLQEHVQAQAQMKGAPENGNGGATSPSNWDMAQSIGQVAAVLQELQIAMAKFNENTSTFDVQDQQEMITQMQTAVTNVQQQMTTQQTEESHQTMWTRLTKAFEYLFTFAVVAISVCTGNFGLAAIALVLLIATQSGAVSKVTDAISTGLQNCGLSKNLANTLSSLIVIAATIIVTCGASLAFSAGAVAEAAVEEGAEVAGDAVENGGAQVANEAAPAENVAAPSTQADGLLNKAGNLLKTATKFVGDHNPFKQLPSWANYTILMGTQAVVSTNFFEDMLNSIAQKTGMSNKEKQKLEDVIKVLQAIIVMWVTGSTMSAIGSEGASPFSDDPWKKLRSTQLFQVVNYSTVAFGLSAAASQAGLAKVDVDLSKTQLLLNSNEASLTLYQNLVQMLNGSMQSNAKALTSEMSTHSKEWVETKQAFNAASATLVQELAG